MKNTLKITFFFLISLNLYAALPSSVLSEKDHTSGKDITKILEINKKKTTVVFFMSTKCPCSISHAPYFKKLATEFKDIQFIGVHSNMDEKDSDLTSFLKGQDFSFPIIRDDEAKIAEELGATKTPHTFVYDSNGKRLFHGGATNRSNATVATKFYLKDALAKISKGEKPDMKFARALGCYIQR